MRKTQVKLVPLQKEDWEQFIRENQRAFKYGAAEEFGKRDSHFDEDGEIISRAAICSAITAGEVYWILNEDLRVGGVIIHTERDWGELDLLFVLPEYHSKGIGYAAWCEIEKMHPEVTVWETVTPYFETRNIHFYVNRCGFHIVEFFNSHHRDPNDPDEYKNADGFSDGMFRFEKIVHQHKAI